MLFPIFSQKNSSVQVLVNTLLLLVFTSSLASAYAEPEQNSNNVSIYWENDFFAGTDQDDTNGLKVIWGPGYTVQGDPSRLGLKSAQWLPLIDSNRQQLATSLAFAQEMYTPEDREASILLIDERPYAGWLSISTGLHGRTDRQKISYLLSVGLVGPLSMAEQTQTLMHTFLGGVIAQGWEHQLSTELTLDASLQSRWRFKPVGNRRGMSFELIPTAGARIGTAQTYAEAGAEARIGWRMADDFGSCQMREDCVPDQNFEAEAPFGLHLFTRINGRAVLRNIFLDGNTFRASHSVDNEPFIATISAGFAIQYRAFRTTYAYSYQSKEYKKQTYNHTLGSLYCSWEF